MSPSERAAMARQNEALRETIAELEHLIHKVRTPRAPAELDALAAIQSRADSVATKFGEAGPRPVQGETLRAFRLRVLEGLQHHSPEFTDFNLGRADGAMLDVAENEIFKAAERVAESGTETSAPLVEVEETNALGQRITKRYGDWLAAYGPFMGGGQVCKITRPGFER